MASPLPDITHPEETEEIRRFRVREDGSNVPAPIRTPAPGFRIVVRIFDPSTPQNVLLEILDDDPDVRLRILEGTNPPSPGPEGDTGLFELKQVRTDLRGLAPRTLTWQLLKYRPGINIATAQVIGQGTFTLEKRAGQVSGFFTSEQAAAAARTISASGQVIA